MGPFDHLRACGCWYPIEGDHGRARKSYLPQVGLQSSTKILSTTSRTELRQTFVNSSNQNLNEVQYTFPLYDGVSVVAFKCIVASKTIVGVVKEKQQARVDYKEAIARGETAGLLEQIPEDSDVFSTTIGNVPANETIYVQITYLGELKHDAETDGSRFTIPTVIAPRYGTFSPETAKAVGSPKAHAHGGIKVSVEVELEKGSVVRGLQSPSHPIAVTMGRMPAMHEDGFENNCASATLTLESTELGKDFVVVVISKNLGIPQAILESHDVIPNQRALMTTLVPKFNIANIVPEIVFVVDRSGSMGGKISTVISALKIFLKSLPVNGIKFNVCSFGSHHSFLFNRSKTYDQSSLDEALRHINTFSANFGGTEMLHPVKQTCEQRYKDMPLEVMLLTDGQIWNQQELFDFINEQENARFFSLGVGSGASSALVEGIARAGGGFAQFVDENEKMDKRVVRMLKAALTPHITDYSLSLNYEDGEDADFEMIESASTDNTETIAEPAPTEASEKKPISLFDPSAKEQDLPSTTPASRYSAVPAVKIPAVLQAPHRIPALYPFNRTTVYLLLSPSTRTSNPSSLTLRGTSSAGPLELTIPVQALSTPGVTIHQLAAKRGVHELEQGRGWLLNVKAADGQSLKEKHEGNWDLIVERECVRLGTTFQVAGKYTSFVAVEAKKDKDNGDEEEYGVIPERESLKPQTPAPNNRSAPGRPLWGGAFGGSAFGGPPPPPPAPQATGAASLFAGADMRQGPQTSATYIPTGVSAFGGGGGGLFGNASTATSAPEVKKSKKMAGGFRFMAPSGSLFGSSTSKPAMRVMPPAHEDLMERAALFPAYSPVGSPVDLSNPPKDTKDLASLSDADKMHKLIEMQRFDGSWAATAALWKMLVVYAEVVRAKDGALADVDETMLATVAVVAWLEVKMGGEEEVWEMVVEKAKAWMAGRGVGEEALEGVKALF